MRDYDWFGYLGMIIAAAAGALMLLTGCSSTKYVLGKKCEKFDSGVYYLCQKMDD